MTREGQVQVHAMEVLAPHFLQRGRATVDETFLRHVRQGVRAHVARPGIERLEGLFLDGVRPHHGEFDAGEVLYAIVGLVAG